MLKFLENNEIDRRKWDDCILQSTNGLVYSTSDFLDHLSPGWCALVKDEFEAVMPLPIRKKWGFEYAYPPAFSQQLGIISSLPTSGSTIASFIGAVTEQLDYAELNLNHGNFPLSIKHISRKNYLLDLSQNYDAIKSKYSRSALRNIKKSEQSGIIIQKSVQPESIITVHRKRFKDQVGATAADYEKLSRWLQLLQNKDMLHCIGAFDEKSNMIAGSIFILFKDRITFMMNGNLPESLINGATHSLLDTCIEQFSGSKLKLDFEGSDFPEFARFYEQYGAVPEYYPFVKINRLPWWAAWLKK